MPDTPNIFTAHDPATGAQVWRGNAAGANEIDRAVTTARAAFEDWATRPLVERIAYLEAFAKSVQSRRAELVDAICRSTGKPRWESSTEVDAVIGKVALTI